MPPKVLHRRFLGLWLVGLLAALLAGPASGAAAPTAGASAALARYREATENLWATLDFSSLDLAALQRDLGASPEAIARHIQDKVRYETYRGVLRGAKGTLLAEAGNSWDRAVLLHDLLQLAGHRSRYAWGTLAGEKAEALVRAGIAAPRARDRLTPEESQIIARAEGHFLLLGDALHAAGHRVGPPDGKAWERAVAEARDHAWVQVESGGAWKDIDPSPGAALGAALTAAAGTGDSPPEEELHRVELVLEVEIVAGEEVGKAEVLRRAETSASLAGVPVGLFHELNGTQVTPVLLIGREEARGTPFDAAQAAGGGELGLGGIGQIANRAPPGAVAGEWLRFSMTGPEGRREAAYAVIDRIGAAARAVGGAPQGPLAGGDELSGIFIGASLTGGAIAPHLPLALLCETENPLVPAGLTRLLALRCFQYCILRGSLAADFLPRPPDWHLDGPNVVIARADATRDGIVLDLVEKSYRILRAPGDPTTPPSFYDYLSSGVIDHTVERALVGAAPETSVGSLLEAACEEGVPLAVSAPGAAEGIKDLSPDGQQWAATAWKDGRLVVMPSRRPKAPAGPLGFFEVDPGTGWTVDTLETGGHLSETEYSQQQKDTAAKQRAVCLLAARTFTMAIWIAGHALPGTPIADAAKMMQETGVDDVIDDMTEKMCGGNAPKPKWKDMPPKWSPFPNNPRNLPNTGPNPFRNPPAMRWPPGAPRGR
jgi:transglutaminase superfamily protein